MSDIQNEAVGFDEEVPQNARKTAKRLFAQLRSQRGKLVAVAFSIVVYTFLSVYTPYYSAAVVDNLATTIKECLTSGTRFTLRWDELGQGLAWMSLMYVGTGISYFFQSYLMASVAEKMIFSLRKQISSKLNRLPLKFFDGNKPGEILSRVTNDLDRVSETLQTGLLKLISSIGTLIGALAFMFYYSWLLTLVFLAFSVVCMLVTNGVSKRNLACATERQRALSVLTGISEEYYTGRDVIRAYNHEADSLATVKKSVDELRETTKETDFLTNCVNPLIRMIMRIAQFAVTIIACFWMLKGTMTIGVVQAFVQYVTLAAEPLTETSYMINSLQSALASAERTFDFLDATEEVPDTETPVQLEKSNGEVVFQNVSFGYEKDKILMKNISFTAKRGQKVAIVGATGAGKTTLVNLLMRFYEVDGGQITLDGIPTTAMTRQTLRQNFGMVLQDTWLFGGTVAQNIAYGKPDATMEEIQAAAKAAKVDYFIRTMPQGYDTVLDNESGTLSVGQRQLITIARVFLFNPSVIILDEATSSVDTRTEAEIGKAMKKLMSGRTSFVIAHRLSTIRDADNILFMENGNVIEQGNHKQLLKQGGAYAALYYSQFA